MDFAWPFILRESLLDSWSFICYTFLISMLMNTKPILAITMGDPAGIGPEIIIKALSLKETYDKCAPIVTGDAAVMKYAAQQAGSELAINAVSDVKMRSSNMEQSTFTTFIA